MLVLTRHSTEAVHLILPSGERIVVTVIRAERGKVRLSFDAPANVGIWREEILPEKVRPKAVGK